MEGFEDHISTPTCCALDGDLLDGFLNLVMMLMKLLRRQSRICERDFGYTNLVEEKHHRDSLSFPVAFKVILLLTRANFSWTLIRLRIIVVQKCFGAEIVLPRVLQLLARPPPPRAV